CLAPDALGLEDREADLPARARRAIDRSGRPACPGPHQPGPRTALPRRGRARRLRGGLHPARGGPAWVGFAPTNISPATPSTRLPEWVQIRSAGKPVQSWVSPT